jgi:heme O synthase-like polyprenyltransferase
VDKNITDSKQVAADRSTRQLISCYLELSKARLASFVVLTAVVGYLVGAAGSTSLTGLAWIAIGTALSAFGANILNQLLEWSAPAAARCRRTASAVAKSLSGGSRPPRQD